MVAASSSLLRNGLYTVAEAAPYAGIFSTRLMNRWLYGSAAGEPVFYPQLAEDEDRFVTFLDFVQAMAVRAIRKEQKVPLPKIRQAIENAENQYKVSCPFAREHTTYLLGSDLIIRLGDEQYAQLSGKAAKNRLITKVAEFYMKDLSFGPEGSGKPHQAYKWGNHEVKMDPPSASASRSSPLVATLPGLWDAFKSEGSVEAAVAADGVYTAEAGVGLGGIDASGMAGEDTGVHQRAACSAREWLLASLESLLAAVPEN